MHVHSDAHAHCVDYVKGTVSILFELFIFFSFSLFGSLLASFFVSITQCDALQSDVSLHVACSWFAQHAVHLPPEVLSFLVSLPCIVFWIHVLLSSHAFLLDLGEDALVAALSLSLPVFLLTTLQKVFL